MCDVITLFLVERGVLGSASLLTVRFTTTAGSPSHASFSVIFTSDAAASERGRI